MRAAVTVTRLCGVGGSCRHRGPAHPTVGVVHVYDVIPDFNISLALLGCIMRHEYTSSTNKKHKKKTPRSGKLLTVSDLWSVVVYSLGISLVLTRLVPTIL
jgi:hypothetical protein